MRLTIHYLTMYQVPTTFNLYSDDCEYFSDINRVRDRHG